jgi:hypothetical protein
VERPKEVGTTDVLEPSCGARMSGIILLNMELIFKEGFNAPNLVSHITNFFFFFFLRKSGAATCYYHQNVYIIREIYKRSG